MINKHRLSQEFMGTTLFCTLRKFNFFKGLKYKKRGPLGHAVGASTFAVRAISRVFLILFLSGLRHKGHASASV